MHSDIQWFLGLIVLVGIMAYTGWSARKSGVFFGQATSTVMQTQGSGVPPAPKAKEQEITAQIRESQEQVAKLQEALTKAQPDANAAPLRGKVSITALSRGSGFGGGGAQGEYVLLQAARENAAPVLITGLEVRSAVTHIGTKIPKAWKLPFPGGVGEGESVTLAPGAVAYLITGRSGNGMSFELNKCTGYFAQQTRFTPPLWSTCPHPLQEPLPQPPNQLSDACLDYLATIPSCAVPSSIPLHLQSDGSCQAHVFRKINYNTCVALHKNEPDFYRGDWRIYLGRDSLLWRDRRETIELLDQQGRFIHAYSI